MNTVDWGIVGSTAWGRDYGTKRHAWNGEDIGGFGFTMCGRQFKTRSDTDKLRSQAFGNLNGQGAYVVTIKHGTTNVECKQCKTAIAKAKEE